MILTFFERIRVSVMAAVVERPQPEEGPLCLRSLSTRAFFFDKSRSRSDGTRNGSNKRPPPPPPQGAGRPPKLLDRLGQRLLLVYLFLWTAAFGAVTMRLNHNTDNGGGEPTTKDDVPCRVIVESHFDYHYGAKTLLHYMPLCRSLARSFTHSLLLSCVNIFEIFDMYTTACCIYYHNHPQKYSKASHDVFPCPLKPLIAMPANPWSWTFRSLTIDGPTACRGTMAKSPTF